MQDINDANTDPRLDGAVLAEDHLMHFRKPVSHIGLHASAPGVRSKNGQVPTGHTGRD